MQTFRVVQLAAEGYDHTRAFDEVAGSLTEALGALGHDVDRAPTLRTGARNLLLGAHLLDDSQLAALPAGSIVYNHEQIDETSMLGPARLRAFRALEVWDYSARNVVAWASHGIRATHVPIGWSPGMRVIDRVAEPDIDVLFYGSVNERRQRVLDTLRRKGVGVEVGFGVYGTERDALIARSRLVLNIQYYEARILEMVRLSHLFANGVPVVSETAPGIDVPAGFDDAAVFATYDRLVDTVVDLLADPDALAAVGRRGRQHMEAAPWTPSLQAALAGGDDGDPDRTVTFVCGRRAATERGPVARAVGDALDRLLPEMGTCRSDLGPPPPVDSVAATCRSAIVRTLSVLDGPAVVDDPDLAVTLPFWVDVFEEAGWEVGLRLVVDDPAAVARVAAAVGADPARAVLRWLNRVVFPEAWTRDADRDVEVAPAGTVDPAHGFGAMALAREVHAAIADGDAAALDRCAERYLDAMAVYLPVITPG